MRRLASLITALLLILEPLPLGAQMTAERHQDAVPSALASPIAAVLAPGGVRTTVGKTTVSFWLVKLLPLAEGKNGQGWTDVEEGTLVGAVSIASVFHDIRGKRIKPGVYSLRYGIQPSNGDHLGVSPFRDFLLLSPAAGDTTLAAQGHEPTVDMSMKTVGGSHPAVWSIDPPVATQSPLTEHKTELGHKSVVMEVPLSRGGQAAGTLKFGVVLIGEIEA